MNSKQVYLVKDSGKELSRRLKICPTILARDWKGFGTYSGVVVIESQKINATANSDCKRCYSEV